MNSLANKLFFSLVFCFSFLSGFSQWDESQSGKVTTTDAVGIGTTSPGYNLDINGNFSRSTGIKQLLRITHGNALNAGDGSSLLFTNRGASNDYGGYIALVSTGSNPGYLNPRLDFGVQNINTHQLADMSVRMTISGNGNVGIGTTSPIYPLVVAHSPYSIGTSGTNYKIGTEIKMFNSYNIPNGITESGYRMGLNIATHISDANFLGTLTNQYGVRIQHGTYNGSGTGSVVNSYGLFLQGLDAGSASITNKYAIYQSGGNFKSFFQSNVGIGTTSIPSGYKLAVDGKAIMEEVQVAASTNWPDYVFSDTYRLNPLSEVSTYIQENHHLPGIPTAEEVAKNGIKLGEMNAKLLEKVEELTLYLIEMKGNYDSEINGLKNENNDFKAKFEKQQKEIEILKSKVK